MPRRISTRYSSIHGRGVFALCDIAKNEVILYYKGQRLTQAEADDLYGDDGETGHTFLFTLNDEYVIDGSVGGNSARWINHSCQPNCEALIEEYDGNDRTRDRVLIQALRDISAGEELTYNYGLVLEVPHTEHLRQLWACHCGTSQCTGTLLQ